MSETLEERLRRLASQNNGNLAYVYPGDVVELLDARDARLAAFNKAFKDLRKVKKIQCVHGTWDYDPYMMGLANGLILAESLFDGNEPVFLDAPEEWLKDRQTGPLPEGAVMETGELNDIEEVRQTCEALGKTAESLAAKISELEVEKNAAYHERNQVVAALSKLFPASLEPHVGEDWGPDWQWVCIIDLPEDKQVSWHIHSTELNLFSHLEREEGREWDGHTTTEKYERLKRMGIYEVIY